VSRAEHPSVTEAPPLADVLPIIPHPDYARYRFSALPLNLGKKCRCGGILYYHATREGGGCDDCPCPEFDPLEGDQ
jgi:hypothetical protein